MKAAKITGYIFIGFLLLSCDRVKTIDSSQEQIAIGPTENTNASSFSDDTKGFTETGIIQEFDCPDALSFPPIDLRFWDKVPAVNDRLPTYQETKNGTSIHHYNGFPNARPFYLKLPKLAYTFSRSKRKKELVIVIQIVQTPMDTVVGYRYLSGGCGGSVFRDFHFLTEEEIKKEVH